MAAETGRDEIDGVVPYTTINPVDVENTGTYIVTYRAKNAGGLWNDGRNAADTAAAGTLWNIPACKGW